MENIKDYKITVFGDSIPKGVCLKNGKIKTLQTNAINILEKELNIHFDNISAFGQTLMRVKNKGLIDNYLSNINKNENNLVVLSLGGNDADFKWNEVSANPNDNHTSKTSIIAFEKTLCELILKLKNTNVKVVLTSLPPLDAERYFNNVVAVNNNKENILKFLNNDISNLTRNHEAFNIVILKVADKYNCKFLDFRSEMLQQIDYLKLLCEDGIHPNEDGHIFIANFILNQIKKSHLE